MRILVFSQYYWPEPFAFSDVCEEMAKRGHEVTVLTSIPNYPEGKVYPGYEKGANRIQEHNGVSVVRSWVVPRGDNAFFRFLNYYSYSLNARRISKNLKEVYDVVLVLQVSPVMMAEPAIAYSKRNSVPLMIYCLDIWPECLTVGGISRKSQVFRHFTKVSRKIYSSADCLAIASEMFSDYFVEQLGITDAKTVFLPQYAEDIFAENTRLRNEYDKSKINLTFAGNVGTAQSVSTLIEAGYYLKDDDRFSIHIVGSGSELENLKKLKDEIGADCVEFHGRHPLSEMPSFYKSSDAMVATFQNNPILGYTLPRKISSYLAAGRPILGTVVGEARRIIESVGCGFCCDAENARALAENCRRFADLNLEEREAMGARGRAYYEQHLSRGQFFETLENELNSMVGGDYSGH